MTSQSNSASRSQSVDGTPNNAVGSKKRKLDIDFGEEIVLLSFKEFRNDSVKRFRLHKSIAYKNIPYCVTKNKANSTKYVGDEEVFNIYTVYYSPKVGQQLMNWIDNQEMDDLGEKIPPGDVMKLYRSAGQLKMNDLQTVLREKLVNYFSRCPNQIRSCVSLCFGVPDLEKVFYKLLVDTVPIGEIRRQVQQANKPVVVLIADALLDKEEERRIASGIREGEASGDTVAE